MLDTYGYKHTLTICNTYCFSTTTVVARKRLNVTLYVHCVSCFILLADHPKFPTVPCEKLVVSSPIDVSATFCCRVMRVGVLQGELVSPNPHQPSCMHISSCTVVCVLFYNFPTTATDFVRRNFIVVCRAISCWGLSTFVHGVGSECLHVRFSTPLKKMKIAPSEDFWIQYFTFLIFLYYNLIQF